LDATKLTKHEQAFRRLKTSRPSPQNTCFIFIIS
jgi:hypothetical protein